MADQETPEGYIRFPSGLALLICRICGSVVGVTTVHNEWHQKESEAKESDVTPTGYEEVRLLLNLLDIQINKINEQAADMNCRPEDVQNANGDYMLNSLLLAKANALQTLYTILNSK